LTVNIITKKCSDKPDGSVTMHGGSDDTYGINVSVFSPVNEKLKKLGIRMIRLFGVADNIAVFHGTTLPDPENIGVDGFTTANGYPVPKKFTLGLDIQF
jgi:hypothetical protein